MKKFFSYSFVFGLIVVIISKSWNSMTTLGFLIMILSVIGLSKNE